MANLNNSITARGRHHLLRDILYWLGGHIKDLFSLEEVEVTFTKVGDSTRYSYIKTGSRHIAKG